LPYPFAARSLERERERERETVMKDSRRGEEKRKLVGRSERHYFWREEEHFVRFPSFAFSSF
jgi:hypothetical protein